MLYYHLLPGNHLLLPAHDTSAPAHQQHQLHLFSFTSAVSSFSAKTSVYILTIKLLFCSEIVEPLLFQTHSGNVNALLFFSLLRQGVNATAEDFCLVSAKLSQKHDVKHRVSQRRMMGKMLFPVKHQHFHNTDCSITKLNLGVPDPKIEDRTWQN